MNQSKKYFLALLFIFLVTDQTVLPAPSTSINQIKNQPCQKVYTSHNTSLFRSFSSYSLHDLIASKYEWHTDDSDQNHRMTFTITPEYMQNFGKNCNKGSGFFGALPFWSGTNSMTVGNNNGLADLDAYQFGLGNVQVNADGIAGTIQLCPKVQHVGADIMLYYAHQYDEPSFYFKLHTPLVAMMVTPNLTEHPTVQPIGVTSYTQVTANPGSSTITYHNANYPTSERLYESMSHAFYGGLPSDTLKGAIEKPIQLNYGRISSARHTEIRMADLAICLGYNFIANKENLLAAGFKVTCPTGNKPNARTILEPIVGRAGLWGVGGELSGHYKIWEHEHKAQALHIDLQGECMHLIQGRTPNMRSFDLKQNGLGSKYLLIQHYAESLIQLPSGIYVEQRIPGAIKQAINITTVPIISKIAVEGSIAALLKYLHNDWSIGLGGEFWGRSHEKLSIDVTTAVRHKLEIFNNYAVIGRQVGTYDINGQSPLRANLCEPLATINESQNPIQLVGAVANVTVPTSLPDGIADATINSNRIPANLNDALDICGGQAPSVITGKVFMTTGYTWSQHSYLPSLTAFGGVEFTSNNSIPKMWSVGLSGNIQF